MAPGNKLKKASLESKANKQASSQMTHSLKQLLSVRPLLSNQLGAKDTETNDRVFLQGAQCPKGLKRIEQRADKEHKWPYVTHWVMSFMETLT